MSHLLWTSTLIHALCREGVRHCVISPGSRSTPLTVAAALHPRINNQVVLDERSAGFIALGIAKKTGTPAVLICTSGTALTNYHPAVTEAKESGVPMIILSADRPPALRGIGSSQTIDQVKIFGNSAVFFHEAGEPKTDSPALDRIRFLAKQAVEAATDSGGAAHINLPFSKPLEPSPEEIEAARRLYHDEPENQPSGMNREIRLHEKITRLLQASRRPLIIAGPANPDRALTRQFQEINTILKAPVIHEPGCGFPKTVPSIFRYGQFSAQPDYLEKFTPDVIIRFGDQPFTPFSLKVLEAWKPVPLIHFASRKSWQDHAMSASHRILCNPSDRLITGLKASNKGDGWLSMWLDHEQNAEKKLASALSATPVLTDGHVFYHLSSNISNNWDVMLSNSLPVRDISLFGKPHSATFVNRGAAGIDGITSTALGIQTEGGRPVCCMTGDLAFLHDSNALLSLQKMTHPFLLVVINNGGGNIFRMLPIYQNRELYNTYFETPQNVNMESLVRAFGIPFLRITSPEELHRFNPNMAAGPMVVECVTDPEKSMTLRQKLRGG